MCVFSACIFYICAVVLRFNIQLHFCDVAAKLNKRIYRPEHFRQGSYRVDELFYLRTYCVSVIKPNCYLRF